MQFISKGMGFIDHKYCLWVFLRGGSGHLAIALGLITGQMLVSNSLDRHLEARPKKSQPSIPKHLADRVHDDGIVISLETNHHKMAQP